MQGLNLWVTGGEFFQLVATALKEDIAINAKSVRNYARQTVDLKQVFNVLRRL